MRVMSIFRILSAIACALLPLLARAAVDDRAVSPRAAELAARVEALEVAVDERLLPRDDAGSRWVAGQRARADAVLRIGQWYRAHRAEPKDPLYLASLAGACLRPPLPRPAACDETDWLAKWASNDPENGLPRVWLAQRALQRNDVNGAVAYVEEAAARPRFEDYAGRRAPLVWTAYAPLIGNEPAAAAIAAANDLAVTASDPAPALRSLCGTEAGGGLAGAQQSCGQLGLLMARHANSVAARDLGARLAAAHALDAEARSRALALRADLAGRLATCSDAGTRASDAMQSPDATVRAAGTAVFGQWIADLAATDELTACEREAQGVARLPTR